MPGGTWVTPRQFYQHLKVIKRYGFNSWTPEDIGVYSGSKQIVITFDDGYEDIYNFAYPIMEEFGFKGILFVVVNAIGKLNTWDATFGFPKRHLNTHQINELIEAGWCLGSHSLTHPDLTRVDIKTLHKEVRESKERLQELFGKEIDYFSYPFGRFNERVIETVRESGYKFAFCSLPWTKATDPMLIPRQTVYLIDICISAKLDKSNPLWKSLGYLQLLINSFATLTSIARHRFPLLAKVSGLSQR